jgi:hypothetical protein
LQTGSPRAVGQHSEVYCRQRQALGVARPAQQFEGFTEVRSRTSRIALASGEHAASVQELSTQPIGKFIGLFE